MRPSLLLLVCLGAGCTYQPGSFQHPLAAREVRGEQVTVGCLDVAIAAGAAELGTSGQVVEVFFANRCDRATVVDFAALRATGRDVDGRERALAIFDPAGQIRPLLLEARVAGREVVELRVASAPDLGVRGACVDVAALARVAGERWVCVAPLVDDPATVAEVTP
jgi:hypothetical protein